MFTLTTGYDAHFVITLKKIVNDVSSTFDIPITATVQAAIISSDRSSLLVDPVTVDHTDGEGDWSASKIVVDIPKSSLGSVKVGEIKMEIKVSDGDSELPWVLEGEAEQGHIS
jgi:hypothetical protein